MKRKEERISIIKTLNKDKIINTILIIIYFLILLFIIFVHLLFFGIIEDYACLHINQDNKEQIITLLREQEENMFLDDNIKLNDCYGTLKKIQAHYRFPDEDDYILYCNQEEVLFSLDRSNDSLSKYIGEHGHMVFKFR